MTGTDGAGRPQGRGPEYTWRVLPQVLPRKRAELLDSGVSDWKLRHHHRAVAYGVVMPRPEKDHDPSTYRGYPADIVTRARAHHLLHPGAVIGGWAAAAVHGLRPDWADSAPVLLLRGTKHRRPGTTRRVVTRPLQAVVQPLPSDLETTTPDPRCPTMKVVTPAVAAAQCLWTILTGRHRWWVHGVPELTWEEVRAVQFIDAFAQCTWVCRTEILDAAKGMVPAKTLVRVLDLADDGAQSPMETVMRLTVRDLLPTGFRWQSQIRVDLEPDAVSGWTKRTLPDLGCRELKLALYYDGAHHRAVTQTDVDFDQFHVLRDLGWEVLRFNRHSLRSPGEMRERVSNAVERAAHT